MSTPLFHYHDTGMLSLRGNFHQHGSVETVVNQLTSLWLFMETTVVNLGSAGSHTRTAEEQQRSQEISLLTIIR